MAPRRDFPSFNRNVPRFDIPHGSPSTPTPPIVQQRMILLNITIDGHGIGQGLDFANHGDFSTGDRGDFAAGIIRERELPKIIYTHKWYFIHAFWVEITIHAQITDADLNATIRVNTTFYDYDDQELEGVAEVEYIHEAVNDISDIHMRGCSINLVSSDGETRDIHASSQVGHDRVQVVIRGWNIAPTPFAGLGD